MDLEDDRPKTKPAATLGEPLDNFSVAELEQRIKDLESEIARTRQALAAKQAGLAAAGAFFKR
jgi:uncharacterized small protein (DUF1192 family)